MIQNSSGDIGARACAVTAGGPHPWIIINALADRFEDVHVIVEEPEPHGAFLARRARRQGWPSVLGQFATMVVIRIGKLLFRRRIAQIVAAEDLETSPRPNQRIDRIPSVNSRRFLEVINGVKPRVVMLAGCRIVKPKSLAEIPCPVLNYHAGITPQYRGMNGGYWALATGDRGSFDATVHLVDQGVDTGAVIAQVHCEPGPHDNIRIYPYRLAASSRGMCIAAVADALSGHLDPHQTAGTSLQWFHPTIWSYVCTGIKKGIW